MVIDSTKADIADDPAHRLISRPTDTTSACPWLRIVSTVLPTRLSATSWLKIAFRNSRTCSRIWSMGPAGKYQFTTYPTRPSRASSSGAVDSAHQNAACELRPNSESPHALDSVRPISLRQRCRTLGGGTGTGPVPWRNQGMVWSASPLVPVRSGPAWSRSTRFRATVAVASAGEPGVAGAVVGSGVAPEAGGILIVGPFPAGRSVERARGAPLPVPGSIAAGAGALGGPGTGRVGSRGGGAAVLTTR